MIHEQKHWPEIPPQDLITTLAIQALPMQKKADSQALQVADQVVGAFKGYWQHAKCPSTQELTSGQNTWH